MPGQAKYKLTEGIHVGSASHALREDQQEEAPGEEAPEECRGMQITEGC